MSSKFLLTALAAVAAVIVVAAPQDPSFEFPAARHAGYDVQTPTAPAQTINAPAAETPQRVSVTFRNATIREVLDWLKDQNVNFVVGEDQVNRDSHVSVNLSNQPVQTLMKALAASWGGHWQKEDDVWIFKKGNAGLGSDAFFTSESALPSLAAPSAVFKTRAGASQPALAAPAAPFGKGEGLTIFQKPDMPVVARDGQSFAQKPMTAEQQAQFEKAFKVMDDPKQWEQFKKQWEQFAKDYEKNFQEFERAWRANGGDKQLLDIQLEAKELAKQGQNLSKGYTIQGDQVKVLDDKQMAEIAKDMAVRVKNYSGQGYIVDGDKNGKGQRIVVDGNTVKLFDEKQLAEINKELSATNQALIKKQVELAKKNGAWSTPEIKTWVNRDGSGNFITARASTSTGLSTHNLKTIYDTLTPVERAKLSKAGFLYYRDLTPKQRTLLGNNIGDESWSISFKTDKVDITIKSDH